jgi:quinol monooxygenase YgiN
MKRRDFLLTVCTAAAATATGTAAARAVGKRIEAPIAHGFHATLKAKPGMGDALVDLLFEAPAFENDNCLIFLIGRSKSNRDLIFLTEGWSSEEAHRQFTGTETSKAYIARFGPLVDGDSTYLDEIPVGGKAVLG